LELSLCSVFGRQLSYRLHLIGFEASPKSSINIIGPEDHFQMKPFYTLIECVNKSADFEGLRLSAAATGHAPEGPTPVG
jgi:hypothetical protein